MKFGSVSSLQLIVRGSLTQSLMFEGKYADAVAAAVAAAWHARIFEANKEEKVWSKFIHRLRIIFVRKSGGEVEEDAAAAALA